ncbi:Probable pectinesterase/pectinesterase inhibitor 54 [Striga hermonthica]|uniref:Probable pectinesterase/pectinesterase inhibitor 54 n=1 Tax=Striga hermonthica TaxID=68872 RepID=A0A9N7N4Z8_STRHE|nr:Probable pectinesterase/pectinesterase inhibitor 54 [Striga hermonthica]
MAIIPKGIVLCVLTLATISWARKVDFVEDNVKSQCGLTRYPALCAQTLTGGGLAPNVHILSALVNGTLSESKLPDSNFEALSSHFISPEAQQARLAIDDCHDLMGMSVRRLNQAVQALETKSPEKHKEDIQTWLSAAITFQQACKDSVEGHVASNAYAAEIHRKMDHLSELVSNPLALTNRITQDPTARLFPKGRELVDPKSFPSWVSGPDRRLLQSTEIRANAVVAKDGSGDYTTVTEAIEAAVGGRFVIYVKAGTYNEKIDSNKDGIMLIGDGKYSTIITGSGSVAKGSTLRGSATFTITGDGFIARDIGFSNTAGAHAEQAVALTVSSDRSVVYRCSIAGLSGRVGWPGFRVIGPAEAAKFTVANFIGGNSWLPSTGVTFVSGL